MENMHTDANWRSANAQKFSLRNSLRRPVYIVNSVDNAKLSRNTRTNASSQFLQKITSFT